MSIRDDFFTVIEAFAEGVIVYDDAGTPIAWNQVALETLGITVAHINDPTTRSGEWALLAVDHSPLAQHEIPNVEARLTKKPVHRRRVTVKVAHDTYRELLVSSIPLVRDDGEVDYVVSALLDVTRELTVVSELRVFERFFEASADLLVVKKAGGPVVHVNDAVVNTLGGDRSRYLGDGMMNGVVHPADAVEIMKLGPGAPAPWEFTTRVATVTGEWRHVAWRVVAGNSPQLDGVTYFARGVDVTERLAEQRELARSRELLNDAFELTQLAALQRDLSTGDITVTPRLKELLELGDERPSTLEPWVAPEDVASFQAYCAQPGPAPGEQRPLSIRMRTRSGAVRDVRVWHRATRDATGVPRSDLTVLQDVTRQSLEQSRQRLNERLNSLGTMAAGVAHEINNPLSFVLANLNVVAETLAELPASPGVDMVDLRAAVAEAIDGAERVRQIVLSMKPFARTDEHQRTHCDVVRIVHAAINLARNELRHRARVVTDFQAVPTVWANESRLGQVFLNLLLNAAHAIPDGHAAQHEVHVSTRVEGDELCVRVRDTGRGIPADVLPRIFDPFFSTKAAGEGVGLGLFVSQNIVQDAGGQLLAESTPGVGSTFEVRLPSSALRSKPPRISPTPAPRALRVLVVDDEPAILRSIDRLIGKAHELTLASSGREALALLGARGDFDLVLCDMMMPELSGIEVWEQLTSVQRARFVFMTGGTFTDRAEAFMAAHTPSVLPKPFSAASLDDLLLRAQSR